MAESPFVSYAQNREDVVLARALKRVAVGRYVDVGANDPVHYSVTFGFYERGWSGITIDPVPSFAAAQRAHRPRDIVVQAAVTDAPVSHITLHEIPDTGLSTLVDDVSEHHRASGWPVEDITVETRRLDAILESAGWEGLDIHFVIVDTEGAERDVLASIDLQRWRPWIFVVEATQPLDTEPTHQAWEHLLLAAGYEFCLFDGLSRFYVSAERAAELKSSLQAPANPLDDYILHEFLTLHRQRDEALAEMRQHDVEAEAAIVQWRAAALSAWASGSEALMPSRESELQHQIGQHVNHIAMVDEALRSERETLTAMKQTLSWRITKPLRSVRTLRRGLPTHGG